MKDYTPGLLRHGCSNLMRIGKPIKVYQYTAQKRKPCPNCSKKIPVLVTNKEY